MSLFPLTSLTLLQKLAVEKTGGNEASWVRFLNLYTPAIRRFAEWNGDAFSEADFLYATERNNRADELANIGIDETRGDSAEEPDGADVPA